MKKKRHLLKKKTNKKTKQNHHLEKKSHPHGFGRKGRKKWGFKKKLENKNEVLSLSERISRLHRKKTHSTRIIKRKI